MADPIVVVDSANEAADAAKHIAGAAGGGGLLAVIMNFFQARDARRNAVDIATLLGRVDALHSRLDALVDELDDAGLLTPKRRRRRRRDRK